MSTITSPLFFILYSLNSSVHSVSLFGGRMPARFTTFHNCTSPRPYACTDKNSSSEKPASQ